MSDPKISNIKVEDISPKIKDPEINKLLPKTLRPQSFQCEIANVDFAMANALRRVIVSEMPARALKCEHANIKTNNDFILNDMLANRIRLIPIDQKTPLGEKFSLDIINNTEHLLEVKSGDMKGARGKLPFNETFTLTTLEPTKFLRIDKITVVEGYGYMPGEAGHILAFNVACVALDQTPINLLDPKAPRGISCSMANPKRHSLTFNTNGTMPPKKILSMACDILQQRLRNVIDLIPTIFPSEDTYNLVIAGETDTIGNLLMKTIHELYADITAVTYTIDHMSHRMILKIRSDEEVSVIITEAVKYNIKIIDVLKKQIM